MFDPIMGVGKTPQVTQDVTSINPYSIVQDEITPLAFGTISLGGTTTQIGSLLNVQNQFFDYTTNTALQITTSGGTPRTTTILFDLGKELIVRGTSFYYNLTGGSTASITLNFQTSRDNVNFTTNKTVTASSPVSVDFTTELADLQFRYFRIEMIMYNPSGGGTAVFTLNTMSMKVDSKQLLRTF